MNNRATGVGAESSGANTADVRRSSLGAVEPGVGAEGAYSGRQVRMNRTFKAPPTTTADHGSWRARSPWERARETDTHLINASTTRVGPEPEMEANVQGLSDV